MWLFHMNKLYIYIYETIHSHIYMKLHIKNNKYGICHSFILFKKSNGLNTSSAFELGNQ